MSERLGTGLEWAATQARCIIHDNDVDNDEKLAPWLEDAARGRAR